MGFDGNSPITGYDIECKNKSGKSFTSSSFTVTSKAFHLPPLLFIRIYLLNSQKLRAYFSVLGHFSCMSASRFPSVSRLSPAP
jgi:hypothetical protein